MQRNLLAIIMIYTSCMVTLRLNNDVGCFNAESTALRAEVEFFLSGSYWEIINIILRSLSFSTKVKTWLVSCLTAFCSVTPDLAWALKSCKYHELSSIMPLQPLLEKDLEEMTQVLKLQSPAPPLPPLLSSTSFALSSSLPFRVPSFFNPTFSHAPPQCPFFHSFSPLSSFLLPFVSFCLFLPLHPSSSVCDACFFPPRWLGVKEGSLSLFPPP